MPTYMARLGSGNVKIGHAKNVLRRVGAFQTAHVEHLTIIRVLEGGRETEVALHRKFDHLRITREWFRFADELMAPDAAFTDLPIPLPKRRVNVLRSRATPGRNPTPQSLLLAEIEPFLRKMGMADTTFGLRAVNDGKLVSRLYQGANITANTIIRARTFIAAASVPSVEAA